MKIPEINKIITTEQALKLCKDFGYDYLVKRIEANKDDFKPWRFDGASMIPDKLFSRWQNIPNLTEIALRHDLKYAYGEKDNDIERLRDDLEFALEVLNDGASPEMTKFMLAAVDVGGDEIMKTSYSWGYARK